MPSAHSSWRSFVAVAATGSAFALIAVTGVFVSTDRLLTRGVGQAFDGQARPVVAEAGGRPAGLFDPAALRLSSWRDGDALLTDAPMKIGDRISITGADGRARQLEVVDSRAIDPDETRIESGADARLMLVTSRVVGEPSRLVRFVVEVPAEKPAAPAGGAHRAL